MSSTSGTEGHLPYFFLSYARTPRNEPGDRNPNLWVTKLYRELCHEILQHTALPAGAPPGFMDVDMPTGVEWEKRLARELATCRVFVPLYSRRYFHSEQCGKEWAAFDLRRRRHIDGQHGVPEVIVPAFWVPVPAYELPDMAKPIQFDHPALGPNYVERGLYGLMKINRLRDHYKSAVDALAHRIIEIAEGVRLPASEPCDYGTIQSAFDREGRHRFKITVVAQTVSSLPPDRDDRYYGASARDWNPYHPHSARPLADITADIVRGLGFEPEIGSFADHRDELLGEGPPSCPGLVLVDPWATIDPHCRELLLELDHANKPWVGLVVPWNETDAQMSGAATTLREGLWTSLPAKIAQGRLPSRKAVSGIPAIEEFEATLRPVIQAVGQSYLRNVQTFPPKIPGTDRPRLWSPQHDEGSSDQERM